MSYQKDRDDFFALAGTSRFGWGVSYKYDLCVAIMRDASRLATINDRECSDERYCEKPEAERNAINERIEKRIRENAEALFPGCVVTIQGDPRGAPVRIAHPSLPNNAWAGDGYCVPSKSSYVYRG